jgi:hypothetical protein
LAGLIEIQVPNGDNITRMRIHQDFPCAGIACVLETYAPDQPMVVSVSRAPAMHVRLLSTFRRDGKDFEHRLLPQRIKAPTTSKLGESRYDCVLGGHDGMGVNVDVPPHLGPDEH